MWRLIRLAGALVVSLASTASDAASFVFTGSVQTYTVTRTGLYLLRAAGAQGGGPNGGQGARVSGRLSLVKGTTLNVVVGGGGSLGIGGSYGGGGGGGSFIYRDLVSPLAVAGGGGGSGLGGGGATNGGPGLAGTNGGNAGVIAGGVTGLGGSNSNTSSDFCGGGGGGGGFSGGGGGYYVGGGGGGSFLAASATDAVLESGVNTGNGYASIGVFTGGPGGVPEPSSWAMVITGFGGIGSMLRRRRLRAA